MYHFIEPNQQPQVELAFLGSYATPTLKDAVERSFYRLTSLKLGTMASRYTVQVAVDRAYQEDIGYLYDRQPLTGELIDRLFPNEGRVTLEAMISIVDKQDANRMIFQRRLCIFSDFDFTNPNTLRDTQYKGTPLVEYSLGQFDAKEGALDVAFRIAEKRLAHEIALVVGDVCQKR